MWYMAMIVGMYIYLPFVSILIKKFSIKELSIPIAISIVTFFVITYLNEIITLYNNDIYINPTYNTWFSGAHYGLYIILGYYIYNKKCLKNINKIKKYLIIIISFILSAVLQVYLYKENSSVIVYYNFVGILLFSLIIYQILLNKNNKYSKTIEYLSRNSLGIFFVHFPILILMNKYINMNLNRPISVIIFFILSIIISVLIVELFNRNKITRKYLLRKKL